MALLLSLLLVVQERWPNNPVYHFFARRPTFVRRTQWIQHLKRLTRRP
jgi:Ca-activated chloride channel family protein